MGSMSLIDSLNCYQALWRVLLHYYCGWQHSVLTRNEIAIKRSCDYNVKFLRAQNIDDIRVIKSNPDLYRIVKAGKPCGGAYMYSFSVKLRMRMPSELQKTMQPPFVVSCYNESLAILTDGIFCAL